MGKSFPLFGETLHVPTNVVTYNALRNMYHTLADECVDEFMETYNGYVGLDDFSKKGFHDGLRIIGKALAVAIEQCVDNKIYDMDESAFLSTYGDSCFSCWTDAFEEINEQYLEIVMEAEDLDRYRTQRRQSRGRFSGGGFGVGGAISGMASAGAMNLASGAVHGAFNLVGKGLNAMGNALRKNKIYKAAETKDVLRTGIYTAVVRIHYALCDIFGVPTISQSDKNKANSLFANIGRMPTEVIFENIMKIISLHPYKREVYKYIIETFGDPHSEVQEIATFFGMNMNPFKKELLKTFYNKLDMTSEEKTIEAKATLEEQIMLYGLQNTEIPTPFLEEIDNKLKKFDEEMRTVDGELLSTREEAAVAREEFSRIQEMIGDNYPKTENEAVALMKQFQQAAFQSTTAEKYITRLADELTEFDRIARTFNEIEYATREEAETAKAEEQERQTRTYDGVLYATKEEAEHAAKEGESIQAIIQKNNIQDIAGIFRTIKMINEANFQTKAKENFLAKLEERKQRAIQDIESYERQKANFSFFRDFVLHGIKSTLLFALTLVITTICLIYFGWIGVIILIGVAIYYINKLVEFIGDRMDIKKIKRNKKQLATIEKKAG